ncbi:glycerophosphodiester phosphodiesterase [Ilumatobacter coccineus]|uniref:Putative phosphodiesterase n=1 Tax=Ilumatobacter coccineus (strain NBRC 103263 / KCTC 29153 / YM16-304) TaxID=1313172 RepID=A0A6C7E538_ILUCY|nr:glycerophosphodiester phosphodiesterase [Ilumatobacter coccineus]BAN02914.1 putative phosphodiesterase [Ilumatobacter coccineus YM16-304]
MQQRLPSLLDPPIAFAHRGARAHAPDNTIESFALALRLGATGLESDVWVTADGVPVLDHDGVVRRGVRRRPIAEYDRADLPEHIPSLDDLFDACGDDYALSLDVKTPGAMLPTAAAIRARGNDLAERTWLCDPVLSNLVDVRDELAEFKLVHSTRLAKLTESPELHASRLSAAGIDAMNMHRTDWNGGLVVMFHRFDRYAFCWDLQFDHQIEPALRMGVDAIYSDHTDLMVDVMSRETGAG